MKYTAEQYLERIENKRLNSSPLYSRKEMIDFAEKYAKQLTIHSVGSSLPDLAECNQASLDYATKKDNPDFFLIKQTFKEGINWALNYVTKNK